MSVSAASKSLVIDVMVLNDPVVVTVLALGPAIGSTSGALELSVPVIVKVVPDRSSALVKVTLSAPCAKVTVPLEECVEGRST